MKVLAVDTTSEYLNLAVASGLKVWRKRVLAAGKQDEKLFQEVERLLKKAGLKFKDLDALVAANGPGSFTGIRVGMTFISMLSRSLGKPAVAVTLLEAQAHHAVRTLASAGKIKNGLIGVVVPAHRDEFFYQIFRFQNKALKAYGEPRWVKPADWPAMFRRDCAGRPIVLAGSAAFAAKKLLPKSDQRKADIFLEKGVGAENLIAPALERMSAGQAGDFSPLYLKPAYYERQAAR